MCILDYGGGDGKIALPFVEDGHECFVVDYYDHQVPGVTKLADDIDQLVQSPRFDAILCSHVLEHVADPLQLVGELRGYLVEDGVLYAEVPQEIWGRIRLEIDPVTHINFFTCRSFETLFRIAGYKILQTSVRVQSRQEVVCVVANKHSGIEDRPPPTEPHQAGDTIELLSPSRLTSFRRLCRLRLLPRIESSLLRLMLRIRDLRIGSCEHDRSSDD
jgi:hypothetical protein